MDRSRIPLRDGNDVAIFYSFQPSNVFSVEERGRQVFSLKAFVNRYPQGDVVSFTRCWFFSTGNRFQSVRDFTLEGFGSRFTVPRYRNQINFNGLHAFNLTPQYDWTCRESGGECWAAFHRGL